MGHVLRKSRPTSTISTACSDAGRGRQQTTTTLAATATALRICKAVALLSFPPRRNSPLCCNSCCLFGLPRTPQRSRKSVPVPENLPRSRRILENCVKLTTQFSNRMPGVAVGSPKTKTGNKKQRQAAESARESNKLRERGELARERNERGKQGRDRQTPRGETDRESASERDRETESQRRGEEGRTGQIRFAGIAQITVKVTVQ